MPSRLGCGIPTRPPTPPVSVCASLNNVVANICRPRLAMTKYSSRTRNAGNAMHSESAAEIAIATSIATNRSVVRSSAICAPA